MDFLLEMRSRHIHGLQTCHLSDMDYRGFASLVPGSLAAPMQPKISWPSHSGPDARIDPFGEGTQAAWGKTHFLLNWCDPGLPVSRDTATHRWSRDLFRRMAGRDVGPLAQERIPEVIVQVQRNGAPVAAAQVFVEPLAGQAATPFGVRADGSGTSWFVLAEPGAYRFSCGVASVEVLTRCQPIEAPPGYSHIQRVTLELPAS